MYFVVSAIAALTVIKKLSVRASISCFEYYYAIDLGKGVLLQSNINSLSANRCLLNNGERSRKKHPVEANILIMQEPIFMHDLLLIGCYRACWCNSINH